MRAVEYKYRSWWKNRRKTTNELPGRRKKLIARFSSRFENAEEKLTCISTEFIIIDNGKTTFSSYCYLERYKVGKKLITFVASSKNGV